MAMTGSMACASANLQRPDAAVLHSRLVLIRSATHCGAASSLTRSIAPVLETRRSKLNPIAVAMADQSSTAPSTVQQKTEYHFLLANAKFMLDEEEHLQELLRERLRNYAERNKQQDFWLVIEPKFLENFPDLARRVNRPAVALISTNPVWITFMKLRIDRVLKGVYESESLEDATASASIDVQFDRPEKWTAPYPKYQSGWWTPFLANQES